MSQVFSLSVFIGAFELSELSSWSFSVAEDSTTLSWDVVDPDRRLLDTFADIVFDGGLLPPTDVSAPTASPLVSNLEGVAGQVASTLAADGWTQPAIAAMLGNIQAESNFDPCIEELSGGGGYGLIQWTGVRRTDLAAVCPESECNITCQTQYLIDELKSGVHGGDYNAIKSATSIDAAKQPIEDYIRWGIEGERWTFAEQWLRTMQQSADPVASPEPVQSNRQEPLVQRPGQEVVLRLTVEASTIFLPMVHTGISHDANTGLTSFTAQGLQWLLARQPINIDLETVSHTEAIELLTEGYMLDLELPQDREPHISVYGQTVLSYLREVSSGSGRPLRIRGNTISLTERSVQPLSIDLKLGDNLASFQVSHQAETGTADPSTRSSEPSERSPMSQRFYQVDALTGEATQFREAATAEALTNVFAGVSTTPRRTLDTNQASADQRFKGVRATAVVENTPSLLMANPDDAPRLNLGSVFTDRYWVIESLSHSRDSSGKLTSTLSLYTPLKARQPATTTANGAVLQGTQVNGWTQPMLGMRVTGCGNRFLTASRPTHAGIDVWTTGSDISVIAAKAGVVTIVQDDGDGYGQWVEVDHRDGSSSRYAHLASFAVTVGQEVVAGTVLGQGGSTGDSSGLHLHFEIRLNGQAVDPESILGAIADFDGSTNRC